MASVTLTITDRADGGLEVSFKGSDLNPFQPQITDTRKL